MNVSVAALGDAAIVVTFAAELTEAANDRAIALAALLRHDPALGGAHVLDIVPAMTSVTLHFEPGDPGIARARDVLQARAAEFFPVEYSRLVQPGIFNREEFSLHDIPVVYGGDAGPDLADVAAFAGCSADDVVARHAGRVYRVYMLGFLPGFAYLGQVDPSIAAPRRAAPREQVPAGSVGIAGAQTGVYPQPSPGGWQIIGRTALRMFDPASGSRLQPGDRVRFMAVSS